NRLQTQLSSSPAGDIGSHWRMAARAEETGNPRIDGEFGQSLPAFAYRLHAQYSDEASAWAGDLRGAVGILGQRPFATRSTRNAIGLVRVPELSGVPVYRENRLVGHTDENGELVIPEMRAYERNRLRIGTADLPLDVRVERDDEALIPAAGSGAVVTFRARRLQAVQFTVRQADGSAVPAGASIRVDGVLIDLPVTRDGFVYLEAVGPGALSLQFGWETGQCALDLRLSTDLGPLPDLGTKTCH
ncbi:MAG: fimbria/pilus outer membrane usher protein, partial [Algiphilus sp.]